VLPAKREINLCLCYVTSGPQGTACIGHIREGSNMRTGVAAALAAGCLAFGLGVGLAAKEKPPGMDLIRGKPAKEAALAALQEAEKLAGSGSWELLGVARVYYLSGDKAKGQVLIDRILNAKPKASDWQRAGEIYADAGEPLKAEEAFQKTLIAGPKDDTGMAEIGAWYIRTGQRAKGEELLSQALARNPSELWHYVRAAAEALLGVPPGR
jgi:tetratricopeptide (TPR) repeat protein